jgi:ketosteroid isomerase-like protein
LRCGSKEELTRDSAPRLRLTIGLRKVDGAWKIAHEHHSFPLEL